MKGPWRWTNGKEKGSSWVDITVEYSQSGKAAEMEYQHRRIMCQCVREEERRGKGD